jgi:hypothetical protein
MLFDDLYAKPFLFTRRIEVRVGPSYLIALIDYQPCIEADAGNIRYHGLDSGGITGMHMSKRKHTQQ